jgi:hypothetical protein
MTDHKIGTRAEWKAARDALAKLEAEAAERNAEIVRKRLELPWVPVEQAYEFDTDTGRRTLADLFDGRSQLLAYNIMFGPDYARGACPGCSNLVDHLDPAALHLGHRDVTLILFSRAPIDRLVAFQGSPLLAGHPGETRLGLRRISGQLRVRVAPGVRDVTVRAPCGGQVAKPLGDPRPNEQPVDGQSTMDLRNPLVENRRGCSILAARGQQDRRRDFLPLAVHERTIDAVRKGREATHGIRGVGTGQCEIPPGGTIEILCPPLVRGRAAPPGRFPHPPLEERQ